MTEQPKEYIITEHLIKSWREGCPRYDSDVHPQDKCVGCQYDNKIRRACDFDDDEVERRFRSRPVSTLPEGATWDNGYAQGIRDQAQHDAAIAQAAREEFAAAIGRESPDTIQSTENDGDVHAWNAETIDRVLASFKQEGL